MADIVPPVFSSVEEEVRYWRQKASEYKQMSLETKQELEEFQESSRELEAELEAQLEQSESQGRELRSIVNRLQTENAALKEKLETSSQNNHKQIGELQTELSKLKTIRDDLTKYIRELEQANDDLERTNRATVVSLEDFEVRLNQALERNAFLESELDDKEALNILVQRLKDEAKELRQELQARHRIVNDSVSVPDNEKALEEKCDPAKSPIQVDSNKITSNKESKEIPYKPLVENGPVPLTPSARISALNIVGDLLRRVGALETKLSTCRAVSKENPNRAVNETNRAKRLSHAASGPGVQNLILA